MPHRNSHDVRRGRAERLQRTLMEETDPGARARTHLELARIAVAEGRIDASARHLREALVLDGRLEAARQLLQELGETSRISPSEGGRRQAVRALLGRVRRRRRGR